MSVPKWVPVLLLVALGLFVIAFVPPQEPSTTSVVVHIGNHGNDPNSAITGLILATNLQMNGGEVSLFLDREGVRFADSRQPSLTFAGFSSDDLLSGLIERGARVVLCPPGSAVAGVEAANLKDGTQIGPPSLIAEMFLDADVVVDY